MTDEIAPPLLFQWDGEHMVPPPRFAKLCDRYFVVGQSYIMVEHQDRSRRSHDHYFAAVTEAWKNLPENLAERFPTVEHLRKFALIRAGYFNNHQLVASSKAEARRLAAFIRPADEYALVTVTNAVVTVWTPQSQSLKAMGAKTFQESKTKVLDLLAGFLGTTAPELQRNAGEAA